MIHRIDRVNPDIDDRVIKPNEARAAKNLRFGASVENTNLSGGILLNGNEQLQYAIPVGDNLVVGVMDDFEAQVVYFALYNSQGNHAIYLVRGSNNSIERIVRGAWLNFNTAMNVSMAAIDGKLYWTDNVNQPRMVNVAKGIRTQKLEDGDGTQVDTYPLPAEEWYYTQIKRQPGVALDVYTMIRWFDSLWYILNTSWTPKEASKDYATEPEVYNNSGFGNDSAYQFSYYYVYDNDEESRLAPWSEPIFWKTDVVAQVPAYEFQNYIQNKNLIKRIVFVYRQNNIGIEYIAAIKDNIPSNYISPTLLPDYLPKLNVNPGSPITAAQVVVNIQDVSSISFVSSDLLNLQRTPVSTSITNARFDAVPLQSVSNEIAQNRLNHANYLSDYPQFNDIQLNVTPERVTIFPPPVTAALNSVVNVRSFRPSSIYSFGIELLDEYGRTIGVVSNKTITIPRSKAAVTQLSAVPQNSVTPTEIYDDYVFNRHFVKYSITGSMPTWASFFRVVATKAQDVNYFYKTLCRIFYWYQDGSGINKFVFNSKYLSVSSLQNQFPAKVVISDVDKKAYTLKGYGVEGISPLPFVYSSEENQYIRLTNEYSQTLSTGSQVNSTEYKLSGQDGSIFLFETARTDISPSTNNGGNVTSEPVAAFSPLWYQVEFYSKKNSRENIFYQGSQIFTRDRFVDGQTFTGVIEGDCYTTAFEKYFAPSQTSVAIIFGSSGSSLVPLQFATRNLISPAVEVNGMFISMNPSDIYSQNWVSDIGQINIVNETQQQVRLQNGITFSDPFVQGTQINGLSKFNSVDFRQAPLENGPITSLVTTNATQREPGVLLAIGTYGISSFYYDSIQLTNVDGDSNVTTTDKYLASQRPLLGQMGCSQPASITRTALSTVYWWSDIINDFVRYTNAGLERLGLTHSFGNLLRKNLNGKTDVVSIYDQVTDEVSVWSKTKPHYTFSERFKSFQGERDYFSGAISPERGISLSTKMFHFFNGQVWVTDVNSLTANDNQFFGDYKNPALTIISNQSPAVVKQWNQIKVYGPKPISTNLSSGLPDNATGNTPLLSYISDGWWIERKSDWEAAIRRAYNTPGGVLGGKLMESRILYSIFAFDPQKFTKLNFIEVKNNSAIVQ
jgi:hypothetical protein